MKMIAVICQKTSYLNQLVETIPKHLPREWTVAGYETREEFEHQDGWFRVILAQLREEEREEFRENYSRNGTAVLWLTDVEERGEDEVFMYQTVSALAERVLRKVSEPAELPVAAEAESILHIFGYLAAEGGSGCTTEAYRKAVRLSDGEKTVFLSLDYAPGLREMPMKRGGVSELVYLLKEYGEKWTEHMEICAAVKDKLTVIAGSERFGDAAELRCEESEAFVSGLKESGCRNLVIDFGTAGNEELLSGCDVIFFCGGGNEEKKKALEQQAENGGFRDRLCPVREEGRNGMQP